MTIAALVYLSRALDAADPSQPRAVWQIYGLLGGAFTFVGFLVPLALILLYRREDVEATFETHDPSPGWTDRLPKPLLGLCLWMALSAAGTVLASPTAVFSTGSTLITGAPATLIDLALASAWAYLAFRLAHRDLLAWSLTFLLTIALGIWTLITVSSMGDLSGEEALTLRGGPGPPDFAAVYHSLPFVAALVAVWLAALGYLIYVRRYVLSESAE